MYESLPMSRPTPPSRLPLLLTILAAVAFIFALPYMAEQVNYSLKRGELRAKVESADAELKKLAAGVELVSLSDTSRAFRLVAQRVEPSVVHINTEGVRVVKAEMQDEWGSRVPYGRGERTHGQGSGVIVDAEKGYIVTNFHVIQEAAALNVMLADGRQIDDVHIVGYDVLTDLAVLQIKADKLIAAEWGDSDELEVGDWVLAIGNPYGLDRTVTFGIVSAKQRRGLAKSSPYQDFLQTDAAVNPGNSGGPLVNVRAQIVGINTAIVGQSFQGISFAIPSDTAKDIYGKIVADGKVARAWLGVGLETLDEKQAKELKLTGGGVLVTRLVPNSPSALGGIRPGDVIIAIDGQPVDDSMELTLRVGRGTIGTNITVTVVRAGREVPLSVTLGQRPDNLQLQR